MDKWLSIYRESIKEKGGFEKYYQAKIRNKMALVCKIVYHTPPHGKILEAGCGTAVLSHLLSTKGYSVTAVDKDKEMIWFCKKHYKAQPNLHLEVRDIKKLTCTPNSYDTIFSSGVIEHFNKQAIKKIISLQANLSKKVIVVVPSDYFKKGDGLYGNEIFLNIAEWERIARGAGCRVIESFGFSFANPFWEMLYPLLKRKILESGKTQYIGLVLQKI